MTALVIAEHDHASLQAGTLHTITAARACADDVHVLVAGRDCAGAAQQAAHLAGVAKVLVADAPVLADQLAEDVAEQAIALAEEGRYTHVLAPASAWGKSLLPRVAARLGAGQLSEVTKVIASDIFERPIYAGNAVATVQSLDTVKVLTVRAVNFDPVVSTSGDVAEVQAIEAVAGFGKTVLLSRERIASERPELASARVVVAGGRGLGSAENFRLLEPLADALDAALGASRAAVDAGFVANDLQVGQTGKIVAPDLYLAIGISGAIQHLAGMTGSRVIVAINKDAEAPIFGVADYGIVGDLFEVVPQLLAALREAQRGQAA